MHQGPPAMHQGPPHQGHGPQGMGPMMMQQDQELFSEVLKVQNKIFYLDLKENSRGKYVKIAEKGKYRPKSSVVVPLSGLTSFIHLFDFYMSTDGPGPQSRDVVVESKVFNFSCGENDRESFEKMAGWLNQTGMPPLDMSSALALSSTPDAVALDVGKEGGPVLSVGSKHFFFDLRSNDRGSYLKIKEVSGNMKTLLVVPAHAVAKFQEAISLAMLAQPRMDQDQGGVGGPGAGPQA
ncbi:Transcription factor Pur-alpha 1 [Tetrabaena socialis]|uniref:Transcription factor Pur-alpha 1 n=1 Tax=Tetrabaena socialis TaxID=47790 RepID=A0A2J8A9G6_9CHLO|nr:Transcription factor Pur-alpha 1 [Tetrabaena socialis]|eukprot:PNH09150.1 Transcription factor Pur-alpha 1 [Tetrabaena socialis]